MKIEVSAENSGTRIDKYLSQETGLTRNAVQKLLDGGSVTVKGSVAKKNHKVTVGETIEVIIPEPEPVEILAKNIPIDVAFEDSDVIVINKGRGMVVHPAVGHVDDTLVNALLWHCGSSLSGINGQLRPGIVHRLDKDTSGLIIVAKNDRAHLSLSEQIKEHSFSRVYEAVVRGGFKEDSGRIDAPIGRHPLDRKRMAVTDKNSREAATQWEVVERFYGISGLLNSAYTHIRCILETGRTHQIRVHMAHTGHPVVGDKVYGPSKDEFGLDGQCLHSKMIEFTHPTTGERIHLETDLPDYFRNVLTTLQRRVYH